jgi:hypothetical protein
LRIARPVVTIPNCATTAIVLLTGSEHV